MPGVSDSSLKGKSAIRFGRRRRLVVAHFFLAALVLLDCDENHSEPDQLYGPTPVNDYLMGDFDPARHPSFVNVSELGIRTMGRTIHLRVEAAEALARLIEAFHSDHPNVDLWLVSGTRNFAAQQSIWDGKWNGERPVEGQRLNQSVPDPRRRALKILEYSSMPGTSRHHWGTDFDINLLQNDYYRRGPGLEIYEWLVEHAPSFGFCQPYTSGRSGGYQEERWHWSFLPLSRIYLEDWNDRVASDYPGRHRFAGVDAAAELASVYVNTINSDCQ